MPEPDFVASIADIKYIKDMPEEFIPFVSLTASLEGRVIKGDERVAILNVATTTSYIAVFLDEGKTIGDVEEEARSSGAALNRDSRDVLKQLLEGEA